jgi:serine/threonine-protein kinase/endoribonuclease IRE1
MEAEPPAVEDKTPPEADKRTVRFVIPKDEQDGDALSRTSTLDQLPIDMNGSTSEGLGQQATEEGEGEAVLDPANPSETPKPKKKAHRGQRGGRKKKKVTKEEEEVNRAVEAAKQLDQEHALQPDEVTISGEGMQDVSNVKKYVYHPCASHSRCFKNCSPSVATVSGPEKI